MDPKRNQVLHKILILIGFAFILTILAILIIIVGYDLSTSVETTEAEFIIDRDTIKRLVRKRIVRRLHQQY